MDLSVQTAEKRKGLGIEVRNTFCLRYRHLQATLTGLRGHPRETFGILALKVILRNSAM